MNLRDGGASEKQFEVAARHLAEAMAEVERLRLHVRARQDRIEHLEAIVANADNLQAAVNAAWECRDAWGTYFTASLPMLKMWDALDRCPRRSSTFSPDEGEPQVDEIVCPACGGNGLMCEQMVCVKQAESVQAVNVRAEHDRCLRAVFRVLGFTYADDGMDQYAYLARAVANRVRDARREAARAMRDDMNDVPEFAPTCLHAVTDNGDCAPWCQACGPACQHGKNSLECEECCKARKHPR